MGFHEGIEYAEQDQGHRQRLQQANHQHADLAQICVAMAKPVLMAAAHNAEQDTQHQRNQDLGRERQLPDASLV